MATTFLNSQTVRRCPFGPDEAAAAATVLVSTTIETLSSPQPSPYITSHRSGHLEYHRKPIRIIIIVPTVVFFIKNILWSLLTASLPSVLYRTPYRRRFGTVFVCIIRSSFYLLLCGSTPIVVVIVVVVYYLHSVARAVYTGS